MILPPPYRADGRDYRCGLCDAVIPDGAHVSAAYSKKKLVGVLADTDPDNAASMSVAHSCGTLLEGGG